MSQANPSDKEVEDYSAEWLANGNDQVKAWRVAFPKSKAATETQHVRASEFHKNGKVQVRILELANIAAQKADEVYGITALSLISRLGEIDVSAEKEGKHSASVSAVMGQAKICGFDTQKIELTGAGGGAIKTESTFNFIPVGSDH